MDKILITPRSLTKQGHPSLEKLKKAGFELVFSTPDIQPSEEELLKLLPDCAGYLAGVEKISAKVLNSAKKLKAISRNGVGVNNIDLETAKSLRIKILTTPSANSRGVAELAFGLMLAAVRSISYCDLSLKNQKWQRKKGIELQAKTLGLIGCGNIGKLVAGFGLAFGMKVMAYDVFRDEKFNPSENFSYCAFDELISQSDVISLHCPPLVNGRHLINSETISKMKNGVYIINTARAELMDESAITEALDSGQIAALGLDVFSSEPPEDWSLAKHPNVIATSHIGGFTNESVNRAVTQAVDNLLEILKG